MEEEGGWLRSLTPVVKCLTCLRWVGTDRPETKPGLAGQEKGPYSMPVPEWMYCLTLHAHSPGFAIMSRCVTSACEFFFFSLLLLAAYIVVSCHRIKFDEQGVLVLFKMCWREKKTHHELIWQKKGVKAKEHQRWNQVVLDINGRIAAAQW